MTGIFYSSHYGSTRQYAHALAAHLGAHAEELAQASPNPPGSGPIVLLAPAHGPVNDAVKFALTLSPEAVAARPTAIVTVGMTLDSEAVEKDAVAGLLGKRAGEFTRFYLPGRLNYSELTAKHMAVMRALITALKVKPGKTDNERNMLDTFGQDIDRVDLARLHPIVEWAEAQQR